MTQNQHRSLGRARRVLGRVAIYVGLAVFAVWILFPLWFLVSSAFATPSALAAKPWTPIPTEVTTDHFRAVIFGGATYGGYGVSNAGSRLPAAMGYSFLVGAVVVVISLVFGGLASYGLSRFKFRGSTLTFRIIVVSRIIPAIAIVAPFFVVFRKTGLLGTPWALIISYLAFTLPLAILMLKSYFDTIPSSIEEAAAVDGASTATIILRIVAPVALPGLIATGILVFLEAWSEFFFAVILVGDLTTPPVLAGFQVLNQFNWNTLAAATVLSIIPPVALTLIFQRYLLGDLMAGAAK